MSERSSLDRRTVLAVLAVVLVVATGCAVWFAVAAHQARTGTAAGNRALVDVAATEEVAASVSASLKAVFSYDYANLDRTDRAVDLAFTGPLVEQYRAQFTAASRQAERGKLVRVTTVRSLGVRTLTADRATVLVFLDQQEFGAAAKPRSTTATLDVTAVRVGESWRIAELRAL